jgi:pectin methylesterase-like acyl-CoA thioesterase
MTGKAAISLAILQICAAPGFGQKAVLVAQDGSGNFRTVQAAVDAFPATGGVIRIKPGIYKERVTVEKPKIQFIGTGQSPSDVVLTWDLSNGASGGTAKSASTTVNGDDFHAENLTFENSFSRTRPLTQQGSQAVALRVTSDRATFRNVRFLGFHALAHSTVMLTAQRKRYEGEESGYVFDHCRITADEGAEKIYLGRPWRWYSSVVFLHTSIQAQVEPAGWLEWVHDDQASLRTAFYAEYDSSGPGASVSQREPHAKQLTAQEAGRFNADAFLAGHDGWKPPVR